MVKIGLDMMGGDYAPTETINGVIKYLTTAHTDAHIVAIGNPGQLQTALANYIPNRVTVVASNSVIEMHEHPTKAFKEKQDSSIAIGYYLLKEGKIDVLISAGNTGAMLVGAHFTIKPKQSILRPAIASFFPRLSGGTGILSDVGLNADCKPENMVQFAELATAFAKEVLHIENPTVGLVNIGEEEGKGNVLAQETYPLLKANTNLNFIGNIEGRDVFLDKADIMLCDGFTGNIVLKMAEQLYEIAKERKIQDAFFDRCDFETYGGSPILGINKPVIIGHGISKAKAFANMLDLGYKMIKK